MRAGDMVYRRCVAADVAHVHACWHRGVAADPSLSAVVNATSRQIERDVSVDYLGFEGAGTRMWVVEAVGVVEMSSTKVGAAKRGARVRLGLLPSADPRLAQDVIGDVLVWVNELGVTSVRFDWWERELVDGARGHVSAGQVRRLDIADVSAAIAALGVWRSVRFEAER